MTKQKSDIYQMENRTFLEEKLSDLRQSIGNDRQTLESEIIELCRTALLVHGKDSNQMRQIAQISKILAESLGLGVVYSNIIEKAACIYDIGNIVIGSDIYKKEDKLTFEEFKVVKNHTSIGHDILKAQGFSSTDLSAIISAEHHEWWDGGGYPLQKKGAEINIVSRIVAIADTVGALFRKRPGRVAWEYSKIVEYVQVRSGTQFDPHIVEVFVINQAVIEKVLHTNLKEAPSAW